MTQFMLCARKPAAESTSRLTFRAVGSDEPWLEEVSAALFPADATVYVPLVDGSSIHSVLSDLQNALMSGSSNGILALDAFVRELTTACESFVMWWGDDWRDLPHVRTEAELRAELEKQLADSVGDVYLRWQRHE